MKRLVLSDNARGRCGYTLTEMIVTVVVCLVLLCLILPAVDRSRRTRSRTFCLGNLKNLALAVQNYAWDHNGKIPYLEDGAYGWPVELLPYLDNAATFRALDSKTRVKEAKQAALKVLTCPQDSDKYRAGGGLSYVANAGYGRFAVDRRNGAVTETVKHSADNMKWSGALQQIESKEAGNWFDDDLTDREMLLLANRSISRATGVFWRSSVDGFQMTMDYIANGDGQSQTLIFSENLNAGTFWSTKTMDIGFVIGRNSLTFDNGIASPGPLSIRLAKLGVFRVNSNAGTHPGCSPAPSSNHPGQVNAAFCDGRATTVNERIDSAVYARLMTPDGLGFGQRRDDFH